MPTVITFGKGAIEDALMVSGTIAGHERVGRLTVRIGGRDIEVDSISAEIEDVDREVAESTSTQRKGPPVPPYTPGTCYGLFRRGSLGEEE